MKRKFLIPVCFSILVLTIGITRPWLIIKDGLITEVRAQSVVVLNPEADAYVRGGSYANTNYGTDPTLRTKLSDPEYTRESFLRFDLSSVSFDIQYAALKLHVVSQDYSQANNGLAFVADDTWQESTLTFNNKPASSTVLGSWTALAEETYNLEITNQVRTELTTDRKLSLKIYSSSDVVTRYGSRESIYPPQLVINNHPPQAAFTTNLNQGDIPLEVIFNASASLDSDGTIVSYAWNFGDGQTGTGETTNHTYTTAGTYTVSLTITDNQNASDTKSIVITAGAGLAVNPTRLGFYAQTGTNPQGQNFAIKNTMAGTLNWSVTADVDWLNLSPTSGSTTANTKDLVTVSVKALNLAQGSYTGNITVVDPKAVNSPQTIKVTLNVFTVPAFPGAEGFGFISVGGRGGKVIEVTNLNDSGTGSLRACIDASGPRICVFRSGGTITLNTPLKIQNPYITIAGQTAPGGGITLRNNSSTNKSPTLYIMTDDVIVRYLRVRSGASIAKTCCLIAIDIIEGSHDVIVDHVSTSWSTDQTMTIWNDHPDVDTLENVTVQWSFINEALHKSTHEKGAHSTAAIFGGKENRNISFHHNLMAHNDARHPRVKITGLADIVNNVVYNYGSELSYASTAYGSFTLNYVGNYVKRGPSTTTGDRFVKLGVTAPYTLDTFVQGNIDRYRTSNDLAENLCVDPRHLGYLVPTRHPAPPITTYSCNSATDCEVYNQVLEQAGANAGLDAQGNYYIRRDAVDKRNIEEVKRGEGKIIDATSLSTKYNETATVYLTPQDYTKYGITDPIADDGWPILEAGTPYPDTDHDGMSDEWENNHLGDLSRGSATDSSSDHDGDGYTDLEEFLNGTNPKDGLPASPTPTSEPPTPTPYQHCLPLGDIDCSGKVNSIDFSYLIAYYNTPDPKADLDKSGQVNALDVSQLLTNFGKRG